jgi:hypothetical protein
VLDPNPAIWFSADWKEIVWTCKEEMALDPPPKFDYLRDVDLIKSHMIYL